MEITSLGLTFIFYKTKGLNDLISKIFLVLNSRMYLALNLINRAMVFSFISSLTSTSVENFL